MTRLSGWPALLDRFLVSNQHRGFQYGRWDCCLFVCDAIQVMTGVDPAAAFRNRYSTRKEARQAIREYTGEESIQSIAVCITARVEMPEIPTLRASRGDVVLVQNGRLGLMALNGRDLIVTSPRGLWRIPRSMGIRAWQV